MGEPECRICLYPQSDNKDLLLQLPCKCHRGTMAYCHAYCLSKCKVNNKCEICKGIYPSDWHETYIRPAIISNRRRSRTPPAPRRGRGGRLQAIENARRQWVEQHPELAEQQQRQWAVENQLIAERLIRQREWDKQRVENQLIAELIMCLLITLGILLLMFGIPRIYTPR
jgi:hypothetical protein